MHSGTVLLTGYLYVVLAAGLVTVYRKTGCMLTGNIAGRKGCLDVIAARIRIYIHYFAAEVQSFNKT
jgi:hypothetical protein